MTAVLAVTPYLVDKVIAGLILVVMAGVAVFGDRTWFGRR